MKSVDEMRMEEAVMFWDPDTTISLIQYKFAKQLKLKGQKCNILVQHAGHDTELWRTHSYLLIMVDREGNEHQVTLYGVQEITQKIDYVSVSSLASLFPDLKNPDNILWPSGDVHLLIGLDHAAIHPRVIHTNGNLRLLSSCFGSGSLLDG